MSEDNISVITETSSAAALRSKFINTNPYMCEEDRHFAYKSLISDIADSLHERDLKNILWRYKEELPAEVQTKSCGLDVLNHLHEKGKLSQRRVESLKKLMSDLKRNDLEEKVEHFQQLYPALPAVHTQSERHFSLPSNTSGTLTQSTEKRRTHTYPEGQLNSMRPRAVITNPQQESGFNQMDQQPPGDVIMSPGLEVYERSVQGTGMGYHPQSFQPVMNHEPMSVPVGEPTGQQLYFDERPASNFSLRSGTNTPGSISASSFSMYSGVMPPHSNRSQHSSAHASFENFSHPSNFSLSSGDSHPYSYGHPNLAAPPSGYVPWYDSQSSLPNANYSPHLSYNHSYRGSAMTMPPRRAMTADHSLPHSRLHSRRHTINSSMISVPPNVRPYHKDLPPQYHGYTVNRGMHPRMRTASYECSGYNDQLYQTLPSYDDVYHRTAVYSGFSHSQPSNGAHHDHFTTKPLPQPNNAAAVAPQEPVATRQIEKVSERAWATANISEHFSGSVAPSSRQSESNSDWEKENYCPISDKQSDTSHSVSTEHAQSYNKYAYESDHGSEDSGEMPIVYSTNHGKQKDENRMIPHPVTLRKKGKKWNQQKRYSLQPTSHNDDRCSSMADKRRPLSSILADEQQLPHMLSKPSEDTLMGSPNGSLLASVRSQQTHSSRGSSDDIPERKCSQKSDKQGVTTTPSKKQRTPKSFLFTRSHVYKPHEELVWRVKRDKLNKMIYKRKVNKYIACNDKIELDHAGPYPKLLLRLHPYGVEEDQNENVTLEVRIERSKKTGFGSVHSSTEVEVCVKSEDVEKGMVIGKERQVRESVRSSFFFVKRFISHQELKQSHSEYIEIRATAKLLFPM